MKVAEKWAEAPKVTGGASLYSASGVQLGRGRGCPGAVLKANGMAHVVLGLPRFSTALTQTLTELHPHQLWEVNCGT